MERLLASVGRRAETTSSIKPAARAALEEPGRARLERAAVAVAAPAVVVASPVVAGAMPSELARCRQGIPVTVAGVARERR